VGRARQHVPLPAEWIADQRDQLGVDADRLFTALGLEPPVAVRVNPRAGSDRGEPVPWCANGTTSPSGLCSRSILVPRGLLLRAGGIVHAQEEAVKATVPMEIPLLALDARLLEASQHTCCPCRSPVSGGLERNGAGAEAPTGEPLEMGRAEFSGDRAGTEAFASLDRSSTDRDRCAVLGRGMFAGSVRANSGAGNW
jgi:hypothetical protein